MEESEQSLWRSSCYLLGIPSDRKLVLELQ